MDEHIKDHEKNGETKDGYQVVPTPPVTPGGAPADPYASSQSSYGDPMAYPSPPHSGAQAYPPPGSASYPPPTGPSAYPPPGSAAYPPPPPPPGPAYYSSPNPASYPPPASTYSATYGSGYETKGNQNKMIMILTICLTSLIAILITLCIIFFVKPDSKPDPKPPFANSAGEDPVGEKPEKTEFVTYISDAGIYIRSGAGTGYAKVYYVKAADRSVRLEHTGNSQTGSDGYTWYEVKLPTGQLGWVRSDIVIPYNGPDTPMRKSIKPKTQPKYGSSGYYYVTAKNNSGIYVRSGPGKNYSKVTRIAPGDTSVRLYYTYNWSYGRDGEGYVWYNVILPNGSYGWVRSDLVR